MSSNVRGARALIWAALVSIPASIVLSWLTLNAVWQVGGWVGAGHEPIPALVNVAFVPGIACALVGLVVVVLAAMRRAFVGVACGLFAVIAGIVQFGLIGVAVFLGHIS